ncbi:MAG: glycosyltransferase family 2 protein [Actinomycetota bacterium]|nr:glycosyltransferase family 2 protein [Actinomycetota bacterium]
MLEDGDGLSRPRVSVGIPVLNEERHLAESLEAIGAQTYGDIIEVLVVDGGSTDRTREIAAGFPLVRVLDNPRRSRPAGLNVAIAAAKGDVFVRVDARTVIAPDYVERCVAALGSSHAAIVGGPMRLSAATTTERAIKAAMTSRLGSGPARFRREEGSPRFVDTVYLGACFVETARQLGGYDEWFGGNEDAELAFRAQRAGGVYLDPSIRSSYAVREGLASLWRQYHRYGRNRTRTMLKHPRSVSPRQLAVPGLMLGLLSPWRKPVACGYLAAVLGRGGIEAVRDPQAAPMLVAALPVMHAAWGTGFVREIARRLIRPRSQ